MPNEIYDYDKYLTPDYIINKMEDNENLDLDSLEESNEKPQKRFKLLI